MSELRNFILRGETLGLYRAFVRASGVVPRESRGELMNEVRRQFEHHRQTKDAEAIKFLLRDGRDRLKQLREMIALQS